MEMSGKGQLIDLIENFIALDWLIKMVNKNGDLTPL